MALRLDADPVSLLETVYNGVTGINIDSNAGKHTLVMTVVKADLEFKLSARLDDGALHGIKEVYEYISTIPSHEHFDIMAIRDIFKAIGIETLSLAKQPSYIDVNSWGALVPRFYDPCAAPKPAKIGPDPQKRHRKRRNRRRYKDPLKDIRRFQFGP